MDMRRALKDKLANYKVPQDLKAVDELPKNAMGKSMYLQFIVQAQFKLTDIKVNKKGLVKEIFGDQA